MQTNILLDKADTYPLRGICMLMIIFHHAHNRYNSIEFISGGNILLNNPLYSIWHWGYLATGVFFFLSGFGLLFSIQRNSPLDFKWLRIQMKKLILPFLFLWVVYLICFAVWKPYCLNLSLLCEFLTLRSPGRDTWFFQVIIGAYFVIYTIFRYIRNDKFRLPVLWGCCFIYIIIMRKYSAGPWWYNSILNFPMGVICAKYYKIIDSIPDIFILLLSGITYLIVYRYIRIDIIESISFTIFIVWIVKYIDIRSRYFNFIGVNSLLFYFLEKPTRDFLCIQFIDNYWLFTVTAIIVTSIIVLVYNKSKNYISFAKKTCFNNK